MADRFQEALKFGATQLGLKFDLKPKQKEAIRAVAVDNRDCFCILPTGYGKSVIYQILPFVFASLGQCPNPIVIVVSPLNALIEDQISKLNSKGIKCTVLKNTEDLRDNELRNPGFSLLFAHPEVLVENTDVRRLLKSKIYQRRVMAVVIDEAHFVVEWKHFRPAYANLNVLGTLLPGKTFVALTATANKTYQRQIIESVGLNDPVVLKENPNRANIYYSAERRPNTDDRVSAVINPLAEELKEKLINMPLTIVFSDLKTCGECFCLFEQALGSKQYYPCGSEPLFKNRLFAQYHAEYPKKYKTQLMSALIDGTCKARVLLVTIAFGVGVDCPNVDRIIHVGVPCSLEEFFQETGRAGRDGQQAQSIVYYNSYDISKGRPSLQDSMRSYVTTDKCRREALLRHFDASVPDSQDRHNCCDNCSRNCCCVVCSDEKELDAAIAKIDLGNPHERVENEPVAIPESVRDTVREALQGYRLQVADRQSFVGITLTTGLSEEVISNIVCHLDSIHSLHDLEQRIPVFCTANLNNIWALIQRCKSLYLANTEKQL